MTRDPEDAMTLPAMILLAGSAAAAGPAFTADDLWSMERVGSPALSPLERGGSLVPDPPRCG